jgi:hypothetical protein
MLVTSEKQGFPIPNGIDMLPCYLISKNRVLTSLTQPGTLEFLDKYFVSEFFFVHSVLT